MEFIKLNFEYGLISVEEAKVILIRLSKTAASLQKLEEGWQDKYQEISKLSDMFKASNISKIFAKCRENLAQLLIQIMILISDDAFVRLYPKLPAYFGQSEKTRDDEKIEANLQ